MRKRDKITDLTDEETIKNILKKFRLSPRKRLGQRFLISKDVLKKIVKEAKLEKGEVVVEIGPGIGTLTKELLEKRAKVTAIEIDKRMTKILKETCGEFENLKVVNQDILQVFDSSYQLPVTNYKILGNLPYQITSPVIRKVLELKNPPELIVFLVQKEVAERIVAREGDSKRGFLSVLVQLYGDPEIINVVSKENFYPVPKVDSAILKLLIKPKKIEVDRDRLLRLVKCGFSQKRKKLRNSLSAGLQMKPQQIDKLLEQTGIDPGLRAEDLSISGWEKIALVVD